LTSARVALVSRDLLFGSRISAAADRAGVRLIRVDGPDQLPPAASVNLVLVDWGERGEAWGESLKEWRMEDPSATTRVILFGPHTDLNAHADARKAGLGSMWARSKLLADITSLVGDIGPSDSH
jgi:hypothetical protein